MEKNTKEDFTRYEIARILGARALQIAMDAPMLLKISKEELEEIKYDALKIAEQEFEKGVLPISVRRPFPVKKEDKLKIIKEEKIEDHKIIAKEKEIEEEISEKAQEMGFAEEDEGGELRESTEEEREI
ncbi:MAG: DNA-directed RNA polymerase subunit K [Nanoarchaeota archaeon]|nr:DNA-directed RNA polymerase subunit K [Nanoarchaeota archaeon]